MKDPLIFYQREDFRDWLHENCLSSDGVWLLFEKGSGANTIKAAEALEEALSFGWIDWQMKSTGEKAYIKYFSARRENSKWSEKNKSLAESLEQRGLMTSYGRAKIDEAKKNGQWDAAKLPPITTEQIDLLAAALEKYELAYTNFLSMPLSVKKPTRERISKQRRKQGAKTVSPGLWTD